MPPAYCDFVWGDGAHRCDLEFDHAGKCVCRCGQTRPDDDATRNAYFAHLGYHSRDGDVSVMGVEA